MAADKRILALGVAATALVLIAGSLWLSQSKSGDFGQCQKSVVAGGMDAFGGPFTLTNQDNQRVTDKEVFAKPSLVYFGYTFCPDVCPLDVSRNGEARALLKERGMEINNVFITVDPTRDTPEALQSFAAGQDPDMIGLTGSPAETDAAAKAWRVYYKLNNQDDPEDYLVDHMTNTYLVMPGKGTVEFFGRDTSPEEIADRTACFVNAAK